MSWEMMLLSLLLRDSVTIGIFYTSTSQITISMTKVGEEYDRLSFTTIPSEKYPYNPTSWGLEC